MAANSRTEIETALVAARSLLSKHVQNAVQTVVELMENAEQENVRLAAAKDVLDRSGLSVKTALELDARVSGDVDSRIVDLLGTIAKNGNASRVASQPAAPAPEDTDQ